VDTEAIYM